MKTLILLRHAQAAKGTPDHGRALDATGRTEAATVARRLAEAGLRPGLALVSDARRTRQTFDALVGLPGPVPLRVEPALYHATAAVILALVRAVAEPEPCLIVVGHNPGLGDASRLMAADGAAEDVAALRRSFPTAGAAVIDLDAARWSEVETGLLRALIVPGG